MSMSEKIKEFDKNGEYKQKIDESLSMLKAFRQKYPFKDDPNSIDALTAEDLFKKGGDYFFRWVEFRLKEIGALFIYSNVYRNACNQLDDFKALLRIAVDDSKSLAEKVDAPWERISGMGGDKHLAKKIIFLYNDDVLPIFKTTDLEYFCINLVGRHKLPSNYNSMSLGEQYQFLNEVLFNLKESYGETKNWDTPYFMRFLYEMYPPPRPLPSPSEEELPKPLNKLGLLFEPRSHDEVMFLFSKMHEKIGFPYVTKIQQAYPDAYAIDTDRGIKRIEIETYASQFEGHNPSDCDLIVCWENDLEIVPDGWPEIIQLKDFI